MKAEKLQHIQAVIIVLVLVMTVSNQIQIANMKAHGMPAATGTMVASAESVLPAGTPAVYGEELGVSYNDVDASNPRLADSTINKMAQYDRQISLQGEDLERYIAITTMISCEYCCGAKAITFPNGQPACGCAHSYAMRGLAKYLLVEHPEMSNEDILTELAKWKTLFFPGQLTSKAGILAEQGIELSYINLASSKYMGIESGQVTGGMVGGC